MNIVQVILLSIFFLTTPLSSSFAEEDQKDKLLICSDAGEVGFEIIDSNNEWHGFDVDLVKAFAKYANVSYKFINTKWDGIIPALLTHKCNMIASGMVITPEREKVVSFSASVAADKIVAVALKTNKKIQEKFQKKEDIDQKKNFVSVHLGTIYDIVASNYFKQTKINRYQSIADAVEALKTKKVDFYVGSKFSLIEMAKCSPNQYVFFPQDLSLAPMAFAFNKRDVLLRKKFNEFFISYKKTADYKNLYKKYLLE